MTIADCSQLNKLRTTGSPSLASDTVARAARDGWLVADSPLNGCMGLMPQTKEPQTKRDGHKSMTDRQKKLRHPGGG